MGEKKQRAPCEWNEMNYLNLADAHVSINVVRVKSRAMVLYFQIDEKIN